MTLTIPCLLFTTATTCEQNGKDTECPPLISSLGHGWPLLLLPAIYVGIGIIIGRMAARIGHAPDDFKRAMVAAVSFGNSTGLPITLISAIEAQKALTYTNSDDDDDDNDGNSMLGKTSPLLYLSVYLVLYPMLQWQVGGWLLSPATKQQQENESPPPPRTESPGGLECVSPQNNPLLASSSSQDLSTSTTDRHPETKKKSKESIIQRLLPPPVIGSLIGMFVALIQPLRGVLVDVKDRDDDAVLEWLYNGIQDIGNAAVPINMFILGNTLAKRAFEKDEPPIVQTNSHQNLTLNPIISRRTRISLAIAKLIIMPSIGAMIGLCLRSSNYLVGANPAPLLVAMIVSCTPTANNLIVMAELAGENKDALAASIFLQYLVAPFTITAWITVFLLIANGGTHL